jgi:hypothetical protein
MTEKRATIVGIELGIKLAAGGRFANERSNRGLLPRRNPDGLVSSNYSELGSCLRTHHQCCCAVLHVQVCCSLLQVAYAVFSGVVIMIIIDVMHGCMLLRY